MQLLGNTPSVRMVAGCHRRGHLMTGLVRSPVNGRRNMVTFAFKDEKSTVKDLGSDNIPKRAKPEKKKVRDEDMDVALLSLDVTYDEDYLTEAGATMDELSHLSEEKPIAKYLHLRHMRHEKPYDYYRLVMRHQEEVMPFIYTPTVGEACQRYHELGFKTDGLYLTMEDKGKIAEKLKAWPQRNIKVIVVTDGERILGLGDLGANGMGISEGKITLYTAAAGVDPSCCLPVCLDMGTNTQKYIDDPQYKGLKVPRPSTAEFDALCNEFMEAVQSQFEHTVVQFEDFGNTNAFRLLDDHRHKQCCFNDDIQGTAAITLAAVLTALRGSGNQNLAEQRIMFLGAGEAGTGIGQLIAYSMHRRGGLTMEEALQHCYFVDSKGLVCKARQGDLQHHKEPFAHDVPFCPDLVSAVKAVKPTVLIGVSTVAGAFTEEIVKLMAEYNEYPIIMPLSNPTSKSECTFEQAYKWTKGKVIFASGSPFNPVLSPNGAVITPAQANNAYIFPAVGHSASLMKWPEITDYMFLLAAEGLASMQSVEDIRTGRLFPPFSTILDTSAHIMAHLLFTLVGDGKSHEEWKKVAENAMWHYSSLPHVKHS